MNSVYSSDTDFDVKDAISIGENIENNRNRKITLNIQYKKVIELKGAYSSFF